MGVGSRRSSRLEDLQLFVEALPLLHFILFLSVESALCTRDFTVETGAERTSAISSKVISSSKRKLRASR